MLPPITDCLLQHLRQSNYQAFVWSDALEAMQDLESQEGHRWMKDGELLVPLPITDDWLQWAFSSWRPVSARRLPASQTAPVTILIIILIMSVDKVIIINVKFTRTQRTQVFPYTNRYDHFWTWKMGLIFLTFFCTEADIEYGMLRRLSQNVGNNRFVLAQSATLIPKCDWWEQQTLMAQAKWHFWTFTSILFSCCFFLYAIRTETFPNYK